MNERPVPGHVGRFPWGPLPADYGQHGMVFGRLSPRAPETPKERAKRKAARRARKRNRVRR